jgi:diacylglycerol kinase family enzyme
MVLTEPRKRHGNVTPMLPSPSRLRPQTELLTPETRGELRLVPREARVAVLLNANAKRVGPRVQKLLSDIVPKDDLFFSRSLEEAEGHARTIVARRYSTVLAGGGDGTITNTMNMLLRASEAQGRAQVRHALPDIGILRLGTGNGLACMTGAGKPIEDVVRALNGEPPVAHPLRLIQDVSTGWVLPFCSMGYDAQVLNDYVDICSDAKSSMTKAFAKSLAGYFYALGTRTIPHELKHERAHVRIVATGRSSIMDPETDEEIPLEKGATLFEGIARSISAGTSPYYGFGLMVHPFARRRMDRFHLRVSSASISYLLSHLPSLWKGTMRTSSVVDFLVEGVVIESSVKMPLQIAGDARGLTDRLELRLSDRAFRLLEGAAAEKD